MVTNNNNNNPAAAEKRTKNNNNRTNEILKIIIIIKIPAIAVGTLKWGKKMWKNLLEVLLFFLLDFIDNKFSHDICAGELKFPPL